MAAIRSEDKGIGVAAAKALARIAPDIADFPALASEVGLTETQQTELIDSRLRFADSQAKAGNKSTALDFYKSILTRNEEQFQCAAIVGIGKLGTADGAALLLPKTKSSNRNVRMTAQKVWKGMANA